MLGDISPQTVRITQQAVVYPSRDHVTSLRVERFDGRTYKPVDMTAVTRVILSFPEADPVIVYDSSVQAVFTHVGATLTVDLSDYAMPASVLGCQIILYDAEHPAGQVLVDDIDAVVQFDFRNVSPVGGIPAPAVDYLTDAPIDGVTYARKDGLWVPVDALISGVASVNGQSGVVVLDAADVGADAAGTGASQAASAVAAHVALSDPHPQYLTPAEGNTAYDAIGAAASAVGTHVAASDPHPQYLTPAEGNAAYDALGAAASEVSTHVAASDPHPQYNTQAEGDARYERNLTAGANITIDRTNPAAPVISASGGGGGAVDSVNGQTGVVVLDTDDIAEGVSNLYFTNGRAAAAAPVQTVDGQTGAVSLSSSYAPLSHVGDGGAAHSNAVAAGAAGFMTGADKTKLNGIATGATQNSSDATLLARANHTGTQTASTISDFNSATRAQVEAELVAGANVTITPSGTGATRQLTIASTGSGGVSSVSGTAPIVSSGGATPAISINAATTSLPGSMSAADKTKLDGIATGAQVNVPTDLSLGTITATAIPVNSSTGADISLPVATTSLAGLQSAADKTKLDGIASGAQVNVPTDLSLGTITTTTIPLNSSSGADVTLPAATTSLAGLQSAADKTKLDGVATGATANSPNATLLARANHTGTQAISTVSGLQAAVDRIDTDAKTNTATSGNTQSRSLTVTVSPTGATTQQQHSLSITTKYQSNNALSAGGWITSLRLENQVIGTANVDKSVAAACYTTVVGGAQLDKALGFEAVVSGLDGTSNINQGSGFYSANLVSVPGIERINRYYAFANDWKDGSIKNVGRYLKAQDVVGGSILREVGPTDHPGYVAGRYYGPKTTYNLQLLALIAGFGYITPFYCAERTTFDKIGIRLVTPVAGSTLRLGVAYLENGVPTYLVYGSAAIASTTAGDIEATGINTSLEAGVYALVVVSTGAITINSVTAFWSRDFFGRSSSVTDDSTPLLSIGASALPSVMPAPAGYFATNGTIPDIWLRK